MLLGTNSDDRLTGGDGADQIMGGAGDDRLTGGDGADIIVDGAGQDRLWGGEGADVFVLEGDGSKDTIEDFELGVDRIDMSAMGRFYTVGALEFDSKTNGARLSINGEVLEIKTSDNSRLSPEDFDYSDLTDLWHIATEALPLGDQEVSGTTGSDMILGAEGADTISGGSGGDTISGGNGDDVLVGGTVDAEFDALAASVTRLYLATLNRAPDEGGHLDWIETLAAGQRDLESVAAGFVNSAEFQRDYGSTTDTQFVTLLYNNVLGRAPDTGGLQGWLDALQGGGYRARRSLWGFPKASNSKQALPRMRCN